MSMKRCSACGMVYRTGAIAYVSDGPGALKRQRVCGGCMKSAVAVVLHHRGKGEARARCQCGNAAVRCAGCANEAEKKDRAKVVAGAVKKIRRIVKAYEMSTVGETNQGIATGLRMATNMLVAGDWETS